MAATAPFTTVRYYLPPEDIPKIKGAIMAHNGELDTRLAGDHGPHTTQLSRRPTFHMKAISTPEPFTGFNCDATPERYNKAAADLAWQRTIDWFNKYTRAF